MSIGNVSRLITNLSWTTSKYFLWQSDACQTTPSRIKENGGGGGAGVADPAPSRFAASVYLTLRLADGIFIQCEVPPCKSPSTGTYRHHAPPIS